MSNAAVHSPLLSVAETATRLRVSEKTIRRLIARGELPALRVGSQIRIDVADLERWLHGEKDEETVTRLEQDILAAHERGDAGELERLRAEYRKVAVVERPVALLKVEERNGG